MRARVRHEWLQKHATPSSASGDFHWHPAIVDGDLRAEIAERARGCAAWARLAPGRVVWATGFDEIAPADGRRYPGLVVTVIESIDAIASAAALLAAVPAIAARPWASEREAASGDDLVVEVVEPPPLASGAAFVSRWSADEAGAAAGALRTAEPMACAAIDEATPRALATLDTWIDDDLRACVRDVAIVRGAAAAAAALDHYAGRAWCAVDAVGARRVWRSALALATREGVAAEALFDDLAALAAAWDRAGDLDAWLVRAGVIGGAERDAAAARGLALVGDDAGWLWNRIVHAWGRGCFAPAVTERLAGTLARRILADHLIALERDAQPLRYWRRLRWEALLPRERRDHLAAGVRARIPSLVDARG
jgi:hypothetical protein